MLLAGFGCAACGGFSQKKLKNSSEAVVKQNKAGAKQSKAVVKLFVGCLRAVCTGSMQ